MNKRYPFEAVGIAFVGPIYVIAEGTTLEGHIMLFTCAVTRAIHLELANDMSTKAFLLAFRRFARKTWLAMRRIFG